MGCAHNSSLGESTEADQKDSENKDSNKNNPEKKEQKEQKKEEKDQKKEDKSNTKKEKKEDKTKENKEQTNKEKSKKEKINVKKKNYEGVVLMKGVEDCIPEDLNEDEIYQLVEDALYAKSMGDSESNKVTKEQAKAISTILYKKIHKKSIKMEDYPSLDGINVKIGVVKFTKDVVRNMIFNNKDVDDCQINLTYANLAEDGDNLQALTIELSP